MEIGVEKPFEKAISKTLDICFNQFELNKWFVWGFSAWLMLLGEGGGGGGGFNFPLNFGGSGGPGSGGAPTVGAPSPTGSVLPQLQSLLSSQIVWFMLGATVLLALLGIAIWIFIIWVSSRFHFIFLDNIVQNHTMIVNPWHIFSDEGNALFKWRIIFGICAFFIMALAIVFSGSVVVAMCWESIKVGQMLPMGIAGIIIGVVLLFLFILPLYVALFLVAFAVRHFIIPLMYRKTLGGVGSAWRILKPIMLVNKKSFAIYWLVCVALSCAVAFLMAAVMFGTCFLCCLGCIPIVGGYLIVAVTIPIHVFSRLFAVEFIAQFDPPSA